MSIGNVILFTLLAASQSWLAWHRLLAYLRYFQQEAYEPLRFLRWARVRSLGDPAAYAAVAGFLIAIRHPYLAALFFAAATMIVGFAQPDPITTGKIRLNLTPRARRVLIGAIALASVSWLLLTFAIDLPDLRSAYVASIAAFVLMPAILLASNGLLVPFERAIQRRYEMEAVARVRETDPFVIGITGSYGKSSSKAILAHILRLHAPTLSATGSINTLMGITRHIRDELVPATAFMVVEMGAFRVGSIRRLCGLTPPNAGLITAVGDMHMERFGSAQEIIKAKSELAESLPAGALLVVNADSPGALTIAKAATQRRVLLYGETSAEDLETRLCDVHFTREGTTFVLKTRDRAFSCFTPLLGRPIILNIAGAFTLARALGVSPALIVGAIRTLRPVSNRLEVVEENGITWIRDAYNSNQFGFRAALEVSASLPADRRFLVTPGVIELGGDQASVNRTLSREAAAVCDKTVVVADANREAFVQGHKDAGREDALVCVANRTEAFAWLKATLHERDSVVLENDLPDLHERSAGLFWKPART